MIGTIYEAKIIGSYMQDEIEYRCPLCYDSIDMDCDSDEEYLFYKGNIYHCDCVNDLIKEHGVDYIRDELQKDYFEWYFNCSLHGDIEWSEELEELLFADTENIELFIKEDSIEYFIDWIEEEGKNEKTIHTD
jgi:hypothetical protein